MYSIIKNVIERGNYELKDMLNKIKEMYIENEITKENREELEDLARKDANPENSYAPLQEQIDNLYKYVNTLKETVEANARGMASIKEAIENLGGQIEKPELPSTEEYPEYKQPTGEHDSYKKGDKITFEGKKYKCLLEVCVWSPTEYPSAWEEIL